MVYNRLNLELHRVEIGNFVKPETERTLMVHELWAFKKLQIANVCSFKVK